MEIDFKQIVMTALEKALDKCYDDTEVKRDDPEVMKDYIHQQMFEELDLFVTDWLVQVERR